MEYRIREETYEDGRKVFHAEYKIDGSDWSSCHHTDRCGCGDYEPDTYRKYSQAEKAIKEDKKLKKYMNKVGEVIHKVK